jgi:transcriptional regulator with XRE-family HTH domain
MSPRRLKTVLKALREDRGWTMAKLAKEAGVTDAYIAQLETGKRNNPSLVILKRLARALGVPVTELLE